MIRRLVKYGAVFAAGQAFELFVLVRRQKRAEEYVEAALVGAVQGFRDWLKS